MILKAACRLLDKSSVSLELGQSKGTIRELVDKPEESHQSKQSVKESALERRFEIDLPILYPGDQTIPIKILVQHTKGDSKLIHWNINYFGQMVASPVATKK